MPLYSASPPQTPPSIDSVPLRRSWGRDGGAGGCSVEGGGSGVAEVMRQACSTRPRRTIGEAPDPSLIRPCRESPDLLHLDEPRWDKPSGPETRQGPDGR